MTSKLSSMSYLILKYATFVEPKVVVGTEKVDDKFSNIVTEISDVIWNIVGVRDFTRPPSKGFAL